MTGRRNVDLGYGEELAVNYYASADQIHLSPRPAAAAWASFIVLTRGQASELADAIHALLGDETTTVEVSS